MSRKRGVMNDSPRREKPPSNSALAREYMEDAGSLRTLSQAVEIADRESVLTLNRAALRESYAQQAEYLRRVAGSGEPDMPAEEDTSFSVDSPTTTTTVNNSGITPWATALIAAAMALGGIGGGVGLTALLNRPAAPAVTQPAAPGPTMIDASSLRATIE